MQKVVLWRLDTRGQPLNHAVPVLLQVIEHKMTAAEKDEMKQELEATVGMQLDHPNVVRTLKHTTRLMSRVRCTLRENGTSQTGLRRASANCDPMRCNTVK